MRNACSAVVLCLVSGLALAAPPPPGGPGGPGNPGPGVQGPGNRPPPPPPPGWTAAGPGPGPGPVGGPPPPPPHEIRLAPERLHHLRAEIGPWNALPPGLVLAPGQPLPPGYDQPLPPVVIQQLPYYQGYEWRQLGPNIVLVALGTGLIYSILHDVLN